MKRSEIKVGRVYGVRFGSFSSGYGSDPVPAKVVSLDATVKARAGRSGRFEKTLAGGIEVEFVQPTRVNMGGFHLGKKTNDHAGPITQRFVFHDDRYGCGGSVGKCFVGVWSVLEEERKAEARAERARKADDQRRADGFAPALKSYLAKLRSIGLEVDVHSDGSGIHGDVDYSLYTTGYDNGDRPVGFGHGDVCVDSRIFDQLVEIAARHGEKVER